MGLFSNTTVDSGIVGLFSAKTSKDEILKQKNTVSVRPAQKSDDLKVEEPTPVPKKREQHHQQESEDPDLEDDYVRRMAHRQGVPKDSEEKPAESIDENDSDNEVSSIEEPTSAGPSTEPLAGTTSDDLECTVFVKNVPNTVITDRKALKDFKKLFGPDIKSVRFRSIAASELIPRKVAFIKQKLHPSRDAVNSYIVYKSKDRVYDVLNTMNGREFLDHHLFVDNAAKPRPQAPNRSIFIGNLSFDATEEQLYRHFVSCGEIENLRIVRDRKFNIGKGFAYVQFSDISTVQLALLKNDQEFEGRKLRVVRCSKNLQKQQQKKPSNSTEKSFKQKQTARSRQGNPRKPAVTSTGKVLEGERAKAGETPQLGKKRKNRHDSRPGQKKRK